MKDALNVFFQSMIPIPKENNIGWWLFYSYGAQSLFPWDVGAKRGAQADGTLMGLTWDARVPC